MRNGMLLFLAVSILGCSTKPVYDPDKQFDITCSPGYVQFYKDYNSNRDDFGPTNVGSPRPQMPQNVSSDCSDNYVN